MIFETLKTKFDRVYENIISIIKNIDIERQVLKGDKDTEKIHSNAVSPEYFIVDEFSLQVTQQYTPIKAESINESDIGSIEEWGDIALKRNININETVEQYREEILNKLNPVPIGGNSQDIINYSKKINNIRTVYPYVGKNNVDEITITDIEGRLDGAYVYVRNKDSFGIPTLQEINLVRNIILEYCSLSNYKTKFVPVILREYSFEISIVPVINGGYGSLSEVQNKIIDIIYTILDDTEPYIKYVDTERKDIVSVGQYYKEIRNIIINPPYKYILNNIKVYYLGVEVVSDILPQGQVPVFGGVNFV